MALNQLIVISTPVICNQTGAISNTEADNLVSKINAEKFSEDKLAVITDFVANNSRGFTGPQSVKIFKALPFVDTMLKALTIMDVRILQMNCAEVVTVLNVFSFSGAKLDVLPQIMTLITDTENNQTIIDNFSFSSDKEKARDILKNLKPRSCVFGYVKEPRISFAIDVSPSMKAQFQDNTRKTWTRLDFVKNELDVVVSKQLEDGQEFNLAVFGGTVTQWSTGLVKVNSATKASSMIWLKGRQYIDGTNILAAIEKIFSDPRVAGAYLLSDGLPTVGNTDINQILNRASQLCNKSGGTKIPLHTIAFLSGNFNGDDKPASRKLMQALADRCNGTYRAIE